MIADAPAVTRHRRRNLAPVLTGAMEERDPQNEARGAGEGGGHGFTVPDLIKEVLVNYTGFASRYLTAPSPPLMYIVVWLIGMDAVAGSIELERIYSGQYALDNWFHAWIRIMVGGALAGILRYWLVGSIFHVFVLIARGHGPARTSRYIFLYAAIPVAVGDLSFKILEMIIYGNGYFVGQTNAVLDTLFSMVMIVAYVYTVVLCYRGMRLLQGADKRRSLIVLAAASLGMILMVLGMGS